MASIVLSQFLEVGIFLITWKSPFNFLHKAFLYGHVCTSIPPLPIQCSISGCVFICGSRISKANRRMMVFLLCTFLQHCIAFSAVYTPWECIIRKWHYIYSKTCLLPVVSLCVLTIGYFTECTPVLSGLSLSDCSPDNDPLCYYFTTSTAANLWLF